jgi:hypothetical protein
MRTTLVVGLVVCCVALSEPWPRASAPSLPGFGVMGDSDTDEYRADDGRGGSYGATTFNWVELLSRYRGLNFGSWGARAYPRRSGYEFNWALSGARADDVLSGGQASGLAQQVANGDVSVALLMIGGNDFAAWNGTYDEVYSGAVSGAALTAKIDAIVSDIAQALDIVRAAGPVQLYVATMKERATPAQFPDATKRQRVTDAVAAVNNGMVAVAAARGVQVVDLTSMTQMVLARMDGLGNIIVGGERITLLTNGDEPHHLQLFDTHAGTVASGLLANHIAGYYNLGGAGIPPFTDAEILENAGIQPPGADTTAPTVSIISPAAGAQVTGTVTINASASDNVGVTGVTFFWNGTAIGPEDTQAPFSAGVTTTLAQNGTATLTCVARDAAGNTTTSPAVSITVDNPVPDTTPPSLSFTNPTAGALVTGTISVSANATDDRKVVGVRFRLDNAALGAEDTTSPFSVSWNTAAAANGPHMLTATARDAAGNTATVTVNVTVSNPVRVELVPASCSVTTGHYQSGTASSVAADDGSYFSASASGNQTRRATIECAVPGVTGSLTSFALNSIVRSSTSNTSAALEAYDVVDRSWTSLVSFSVGTAEVSRTSTSTSNFSRFIAADGSVRVRVSSSRSGSYTLSLERVLLTIMRTP